MGEMLVNIDSVFFLGFNNLFIYHLSVVRIIKAVIMSFGGVAELAYFVKL